MLFIGHQKKKKKPTQLNIFWIKGKFLPSVLWVSVEKSLQRLALLLDPYGLDLKDLTPEEKDNLPAALKQLQLESSFAKQAKGLFNFNCENKF